MGFEPGPQNGRCRRIHWAMETTNPLLDKMYTFLYYVYLLNMDLPRPFFDLLKQYFWPLNSDH